MKTCLITGVSGMLGSAVRRRLAGAFEVVGVAGAHAAPGDLRGDLRDRDWWADVLRSRAFDAVVHCAAYRDPDYCETHPGEARRLNVAPVEVLCETLPPGIPVLFISSDYVFDGETPPYREDSPCAPVNLYGKLKVEAERLMARRKHSLILRVPLMVGQAVSAANKGFLAQAMDDIRRAEPLRLDDVLVRYPTFTDDVAGVIRQVLVRDLSGCRQFSGSHGGTRYRLTCEIADHFGLNRNHLQPSTEVIRRPAARPRDAHMDDSRLRAALGDGVETDFFGVVERICSAS